MLPVAWMYLQFIAGNSHCQCTVLPFALSWTSRVFMKCMTHAATHLHHLGHSNISLSGWLASCGASGPKQHPFISHLFSCLGLKLNVEKSQLKPTQLITFIGANLNSITTMAYLPWERFKFIVFLSESFTSNLMTSMHAYLQLLGHMALCTYVSPHANLHLHSMQARLHLSVFFPDTICTERFVYLRKCINLWISDWIHKTCANEFCFWSQNWLWFWLHMHLPKAKGLI